MSVFAQILVVFSFFLLYFIVVLLEKKIERLEMEFEDFKRRAHPGSAGGA